MSAATLDLQPTIVDDFGRVWAVHLTPGILRDGAGVDLLPYLDQADAGPLIDALLGEGHETVIPLWRVLVHACGVCSTGVNLVEFGRVCVLGTQRSQKSLRAVLAAILIDFPTARVCGDIITRLVNFKENTR